MNLDECLETVLAQLERDHWRLAYALRGWPAPAPLDVELAELHAAISSRPTPSCLLELTEEHPVAVARHLDWLTETLQRGSRHHTRARRSVAVPWLDSLPLAS